MSTLWHHISVFALARFVSLETIAWHLLEIAAWFVAAKVTIRVASRMIHQMFRSNTVAMRDRRKATLEALLDNVVRYVVYFLMAVISLQTLGAHVEALLAGAGIAGIAVGFGAQSLIRDVLTGFFILFEDQYAVGDVIQINGFTGTVQTIGLRLTKLRAWTGEEALITNGQVQQVINYSKQNSLAIVDIHVPYGTDVSEALSIMTSVLEDIKSEDANVIGDIQVVGLQSVANAMLQLRVTVECRPLTQYKVQREAYTRISEGLMNAGIGMAGNSVPFSIHVPTTEGKKTV